MTITHRDQLGCYLNEAGLLGEGVEVGVFIGKFSSCLLSTWHGRKLWGVDPYITQDPAWYIDEIQGENFDFIYERAQAELGQFGSRHEFLRMMSLEAAPRFADNSLDFVYIDANHRYEAVTLDICAWWPKVVSGGWVCGHDFGDPSRRRYDVSRAVIDFLHPRELCYRVTACSSWFVVKP